MKKLGIYIHWPYCAKICPYCDFNIYRARGRDVEGLLAAMEVEIAEWYQSHPDRKLTSVFFGGGTPSLLEPQQLENLIKSCDDKWGLANDCEITIETNPDDASLEKLQGFRAAGINRLSLGVQSFFDDGLKELGRFHTADDSIKAVKNGRMVFDNLSLDIIYARPSQSLQNLHDEFYYAATLGADHISPYQLTIEENTAFDRKVARGTLIPKPDDEAGDFYDYAAFALSKFGFQQYEISNFAKTRDKQSKHNLIYWQSDDFIGIGPGAHGRLNMSLVDRSLGGVESRFATKNLMHPNDYIAAIQEKKLALVEFENLEKADSLAEYYIMGLRLNDGCEIIENGEGLNKENIQELVNDGFLASEGNKIKITNSGRKFANYIISKIID